MNNSGYIQAGMTVAVVGLGVTGRAAVRYCQSCGAGVLVSDSRPAERFLFQEQEFLQQTGVKWEAGGHTYRFLRTADLVIVSPGIPLEHEAIAALLAENRPVQGELAIVAPLLDIPVVAITGTNGKTTVTSLIGEIVQASGRKTFVGGNIGTPIFDYLLQGPAAEVMVLEVSSFQLLLAGRFTPDVGVLLNITPDHFDRHGNLEQYAEAKMQLFAHQGPEKTAIVCADDPECMNRLGRLRGRCRTFGLAADCDATIDGSTINLIRDNGESVSYNLAGTAFDNAIGAANAAAAILAGKALGIDDAIIDQVLKTFQPGPHRIELVGELAGVRFVNDSKATNTGAVIAALRQVPGKAVLIAGGRDKGEDYRLLQPEVRSKARAVVVIGEAGGKIGAALADCAEIVAAADMDEAVRRGYSLAQTGDTVLLSPACASFDMFTSYAHRGEVFAASVHRLMADGAQSPGGQA